MKAFIFLKRLRVAVSLIFLLLISFLFIDFANSFSPALVSGILYFQFVPSLIKFINLSGTLAGGFILVIILTILFGRIYCSAFCPLGTLKDVILFVERKLGKRKIYGFQKPSNPLGYSFLGVTMVFLFGGSFLMLNFFDPYSLFGKMVSDIVRPAYYGINNVIVAGLEQMEIFALYPVKLKSFSWISFGFSMFMVMLVVRLTLKKGRLYCNTVCPVGTFLGLISKISLFKIRLDEDACTHCGKCSARCKAGCIDLKNTEVDFSRCVGCFNCLTVCPENGVNFKRSWTLTRKYETMEIVDKNPRREFFARTGSALAGMISIPYLLQSQNLKAGMKPVVKEFPVTPPGSLNIRRFHKNCTACHLCISACPTRVLQPSFTEYGWDGLFQPFMDYKASFCNYECSVCGEICPTGAILPLETEHKKRTQLGKAKFIKENCVVYTDETACGACSEHCPTKAVDMVFYKGKLTIPEVTDKICIGCGACEHSCPTNPKSIYVDGNPVHILAEKPKEKKAEAKPKPAEDFPF